MRMLLLTILCAASLAAAGPASQPATRPDAPARDTTKIHRVAAGAPRAEDGLYLARSTGAGFSVLMPRKFNDITVAQGGPDGAAIVTHMVAAIAASPRDPASPIKDARLTASAVSYTGRDLPADAAARYLDMLAQRGEVRNKRAVKIDRADGTELEVKTATSVTRYRVALLDNAIYSMSVEVPGEEFAKETDAAATTFFESFRSHEPQEREAPVKTASARARAGLPSRPARAIGRVASAALVLRQRGPAAARQRMSPVMSLFRIGSNHEYAAALPSAVGDATALVPPPSLSSAADHAGAVPHTW